MWIVRVQSTISVPGPKGGMFSALVVEEGSD